MTAKFLFRKLHFFAGIISGIPVIIIAITGCIYVFSEEISGVFYNDRNIVHNSVANKRVSLDTLEKIARESIGNVQPVLSVLIPNNKNESVRFIFEKRNRDAWFFNGYLEFYKTVYLNPYTGEVILIENSKWEFFNLIFWTHTSLLLGYEKCGSFVIQSIILIFMFSLISGLYLWIPRKKLIKNLIFKWPEKAGWKRKNYDFHRIPGVYVMAMGILFSITGLIWASHDFGNLIIGIANLSSKEKPEEKKITSVVSLNSSLQLNNIFEKLSILSPHSSSYLIKMPSNPQAVYVARAYQENTNFNRVVYFFDQYNSALLHTERFSEKDRGDKIIAINYDLHTGSIFGLPTKIIWFLSSLLIASLPVTGFFIFIGRNNKRKQCK